MNNKPRITILGGGVAGLAAALRLGEAGKYAPLVLEREREAGGLARSLHFKGVSTDLGPHRLHTELPEVEKLVSNICAPSLYTVKRQSRIFLRGHYLKYPPSPFEMLRRLGVAHMAAFGASMGVQTLKPQPGANASYEDLMRRAFGPALYEFMIRPYSEKVWKTNPAEIHADTARVRVSAGSLVKMVRGVFRKEAKGSETALKEFRYVRGGVETLVRHLVEHAKNAGAEVRLSRPVTQLEITEADLKLRVTGVSTNGNDSEACDGVVSTVPLPVLLGKLLPPHPRLESAREAAGGLTYLNIIFVLLIIRRKVISGDNWLYFPEPEFIFNRAYESKSFDPAMGPEDRSVLCVELTTRPGAGWDVASDEEIQARTIEQLTGTGLFGVEEITDKLVYRLSYGYPLYSLDYHERLDRVFNGLRSITNLVSTGRQGLFNHNNTDHSILMGLRAAEAFNEGALESVSDRWYESVDEFKKFRIVD